MLKRKLELTCLYLFCCLAKNLKLQNMLWVHFFLRKCKNVQMEYFTAEIFFLAFICHFVVAGWCSYVSRKFLVQCALFLNQRYICYWNVMYCHIVYIQKKKKKKKRKKKRLLLLGVCLKPLKLHVSFTCVLPLCLSPAHRGCMERRKETKVRREEMRKDVLREMRRPFLGGVTWHDVPLWWHRVAGFARKVAGVLKK